MNLDSIKNNTTWEDAATAINSNFSKTNLEVAKIASSSNKHKGFFTTEASLLVAQPYPRVGDNAYVGATYPGVVYVCNTTGVWTATTTVPSPPAVNISEYYKKVETDTLIDTVEENIASLETDVDDIDSLFIQTKNIYKPESVVDNIYITQNGGVSGAPGWKYCVQSVEPSTEYIIRNPNYDYVPTSIGGIGFLNASGVLISGTNFGVFPSFKNGKIFTTPAGCTKIQFNVKDLTGTIDFLIGMELYKGTENITEYYIAPKTLGDLVPTVSSIVSESFKQSAKQSVITEGFNKNYFTPDSLFTNIDIDGIIKVEAKYDISMVLPEDLYLWFISNGNATSGERVIYVAEKVDGVINSGTIVSAYIGDSAIKTGVEKVHLGSYNDSGVELYMVIDWSKIPYRTVAYVSTDTKLDINYITKPFEDEFKLRVYNKNVFDPPKNFITNTKGDIINTPLLSKIDFDWEIGYAYANSVKVAQALFALSLPVSVSTGDIIEAPSIPSLSFGHAFTDDSGTVIQMFGRSNSSSWADPEIREYVVPIGATKVRFSWYNTEIYWDNFKVSGVLVTKQIGTDLTWENGYQFNTAKKAKVANASFAISNKVNADSLFVRVKSQNISETVGIMCYDNNYTPLGVVASYSATVGELITVRLLNFTKHIAFTSPIESTSDFTYQFTSGILFTSQTGLSYATLNFGLIVTVNDIGLDQSYSAISGKNGISFGDSITWYDGKIFSTSHIEEGQKAIGYQSYIRNYFKCNILNMGESGYTMPIIYNNKVLTANYSDIDFVTLTSGANDARLGVPIGVLAEVGSSFITSTYAGAMQAAIEHILSQNPQIMIILLTPIKGWFLENGTGNVPGSYPDIPSSYPNMVKMIGELYSLPVIDMYSNVFINKITRPIYIGDKDMWGTEPAAYYLHPTNLGFKMMGEYICKQNFM